jgi:hypothetical protein
MIPPELPPELLVVPPPELAPELPPELAPELPPELPPELLDTVDPPQCTIDRKTSTPVRDAVPRMGRRMTHA